MLLNQEPQTCGLPDVIVKPLLKNYPWIIFLITVLCVTFNPLLWSVKNVDHIDLIEFETLTVGKVCSCHVVYKSIKVDVASCVDS